MPTKPTQKFEAPSICFVSAQHLIDPEKNVSSRSAVELHAYANRVLVEGHTGKVHNFRNAGKDLVASQMYFPPNVSHVSALRVWQEADKAAALTGRITEVISNHMLCRLPTADPDVCFGIIERFANEFFLPMRLIAEASIHAPIDKSPHVHWQIGCREWSADNTFTTPLWDAKSPQTREKWRLGWVSALQAHSN